MKKNSLFASLILSAVTLMTSFASAKELNCKAGPFTLEGFTQGDFYIATFGLKKGEDLAAEVEGLKYKKIESTTMLDKYRLVDDEVSAQFKGPDEGLYFFIPIALDIPKDGSAFSITQVVIEQEYSQEANAVVAVPTVIKNDMTCK